MVAEIKVKIRNLEFVCTNHSVVCEGYVDLTIHTRTSRSEHRLGLAKTDDQDETAKMRMGRIRGGIWRGRGGHVTRQGRGEAWSFGHKVGGKLDRAEVSWIYIYSILFPAPKHTCARYDISQMCHGKIL